MGSFCSNPNIILQRKIHYCMAENEFMKMQHFIKEAVDKYNGVIQKCGIKNQWHCDTINRLAKPFLHGNFTLAVVGKMSSGKSTFINALIGQEILPTGHFQTTSAITYIEHGENLEMTVVYADGHTATYTKEINNILNKLVAIPEEYNDLPINDINRLISGGDDVSEILKKKEGIEARTDCPIVNTDLWEKYIQSHSKSNIAKEVRIKTPMPEEFHGWRIVDTPGIGAIGGIQDETKVLFSKVDDNGNKFVDAIILLQSGVDNIEDETTKRFAKETIQQLTSDAKKRLFFVLTHASEGTFRTYKDEILNKAKSLYAVPFNIPAERILYVDSLLHRFQADVEDAQNMDELEEGDIEGWNKDELDAMTNLYTPLKKALKADGLEFTNDNLRVKMNEWANFIHLKSLLNGFVKTEKENLKERILQLIDDDLRGFTKDLQNQLKILEGGKNEIEKQRIDIQKNKTSYQIIVGKLQRKASIENAWERFSFIDSQIAALKKESSISRVRSAYLQIIEDVTNKEKILFDNIKQEFEEYCNGFNKEDLTLKSIDFSSLEVRAEKASQKEVTDYSRPKEELLKKGGMSSDKKLKTTYPYTKTEIDAEKKTREFTAYVVKEARAAKNAFYNQLKEKVKLLCEYAHNDITTKTTDLESNLDELEKQLSVKDALMNTIKSHIQILETTKIR